jgi:hypothetical protein
MTAYTTYSDGTPVVRSGGSNAAGFPAVTVFENTFDATRRSLAAEDTVAILNIPAGTFVLAVFLDCITADGANLVNIGDGDDPNGWVADGPLTAGTVTKGAGAYAVATTSLVGKFYAAADTIDAEVVAGDTVTVGKFRVVALCVCVG